MCSFFKFSVEFCHKIKKIESIHLSLVRFRVIALSVFDHTYLTILYAVCVFLDLIKFLSVTLKNNILTTNVKSPFLQSRLTGPDVLPRQNLF